jgi:hypothetical protein
MMESNKQYRKHDNCGQIPAHMLGKKIQPQAEY